MRFYPSADISFYVERSDGWDRYCRLPKKSWKLKKLPPPSTISYWRDLEGAKKKEIFLKDLYFDNWPTTRLNKCACLPLYYAVGNRFIRITKAFPAGFKCAMMPMNLIEARAMKAKIKEEKKAKNKSKGKKGKTGKGKNK